MSLLISDAETAGEVDKQAVAFRENRGFLRKKNTRHKKSPNPIKTYDPDLETRPQKFTEQNMFSRLHRHAGTCTA